jgi:hypothetical protein
LVDAIVAVGRREWRFSIQRLMLVTAVISVILGIVVIVVRN